MALSAINQRRLANFRRNRRGYWSFWIFLVLIVVSLFAELIANDRTCVDPAAFRLERFSRISKGSAIR